MLMSEYVKINLEDYIQSGEGGQAITYTRKDGSLWLKCSNMAWALKR